MPDFSGFSMFCDDIREESEGTVSYIGVHKSVLRITDFKPRIIPRLCVMTRMAISSKYHGKRPTFQLVMTNEQKHSDIVTEDHLAEIPDLKKDIFINGVFHVELEGLLIEDDCMLNASLIIGDKRVKLGHLRIEFADDVAIRQDSDDWLTAKPRIALDAPLSKD